MLGFVTNLSYLDNPTFRGMRQSLMGTFDDIYLLDLHGNSKKKERAPDGGNDVNVFDIQQGVAIGLFVKRANGVGGPARVLHADLWGEREAGPHGGKYGWLAANDVESTRWEELTPKSPRYLFIPRDETLAEEYESGWGMTKVFPINSVGIVTGQDRVAIRWSDNEMIQVTRELMPSLGEDMDEELVTPILHRPFDIRYTYNSDRVITRWRHGVMLHMLDGPNVGLCIGRAGQVIGSKTLDVCFVSEITSGLQPIQAWRQLPASSVHLSHRRARSGWAWSANRTSTRDL